MIIIFSTLIGIGVGESLYLLDALFHLSGDSMSQVIPTIYGIFIAVPFKLDHALRLRVMNWNTIVVLYYGLNGLIAGVLAKSKIRTNLLKCLCFIGLFVLPIILVFIFL